MCSVCGSLDFPNLPNSQHKKASPESPNYNCIAWAAGRIDWHWWPDTVGWARWPSSVPRSVTVAAFIAAFETLGYRQCSHWNPEFCREKVVIYCDPLGTPTHAARQKYTGVWLSKIGTGNIDIEHETIESLNGPLYGGPAIALRRMSLRHLGVQLFSLARRLARFRS
jgi:hypothetical protein